MASPRAQEERADFQGLEILSDLEHLRFKKPSKDINSGHDLSAFLTSLAYRDITTFVLQLNRAVCPRKIIDGGHEKVIKFEISSVQPYFPDPVRQIQKLLKDVDKIIDEAPPDTGPRRFGNVAFRRWYELVEARAASLLDLYVSPRISQLGADQKDGASAKDELISYLLGAFGSPQRLDYGTGHELSFLAFIGCIWKLGGFDEFHSPDGAIERAIVFGVIEPYLKVIRHLILIYNLEPAGSHGVWGLDDHSFLPYVFGSAQYCPAASAQDPMPIEGSLSGSPDPGDITKKIVVDEMRQHNMYFSAVGFINDVKTGPFWEHSPMLFDISGVKAGWGKINKGMIKMYNAEVLSKFPVVQHFCFGSLFSWEQDPEALPIQQTAHSTNQPLNQAAPATSSVTGAATVRPTFSSQGAAGRMPGSGLPTTRPTVYQHPVPAMRARPAANFQDARQPFGSTSSMRSVSRSISSDDNSEGAGSSGPLAERSSVPHVPTVAPWAKKPT